MADAYVISANQYRAIVALFDDISTRPEAQGATVLTRAHYQNIQRAPGHFGTISVPVTISPHTAWMTTNQAQSGALTTHFKELQEYFTKLPKTKKSVVKVVLGMNDPLVNNEAYSSSQIG